MCLQLGIDNPAKWLDETDEGLVNLWAAYWQCEPWGMPWHRHAGQSLYLHALLQRISAWLGVKMEDRKFADFMPRNWVDDERPQPAPDIRQQLNALAKSITTRGHKH